MKTWTIIGTLSVLCGILYVNSGLIEGRAAVLIGVIILFKQLLNYLDKNATRQS